MKFTTTGIVFAAILALSACQTTEMTGEMASDHGEMASDSMETQNANIEGSMPSECPVPASARAGNASKTLTQAIADWNPQYQGDIQLMQKVLAGTASAAETNFVVNCLGIQPANFS